MKLLKAVAVQGIPLKNLAVVGCRPLLSWALGAAQRFPKFNSLWVSTDHQGTRSVKY
jgi:CMP-N-acetylneuraminic acid synthetase